MMVIMQITKLHATYAKLQKIHGDAALDPVFGAGETDHPDLCLVFMNPTSKNVSSAKSWQGLKAAWLGTKNIWRMFYQLGFIDLMLWNEINQKKPADWNYEFAERLYLRIKENSIYITNLSKATQIDARPLHDRVFKHYLDLCKEEISIVKPKKIITFGNQVSSVLLGKRIKVSDYRKKHAELEIEGKAFKVFPVYYPVGQGMRNMSKAQVDIKWIMCSRYA